MPKTATRRKQREPFGRIRKLPSGRYQAGYVGPDLALHRPSATFGALMDARGWLAAERKLIDAGTWTAPSRRNSHKPTMFGPYAETWLERRELKPRTRDLYRRLLDQKILPTFADLPLKAITAETVRQWYASLDPATPTRRAHAYALLRTILGDAVAEELLTVNPCRIRKAGVVKRVHKIEPASLEELAIIVEAFPARYRGVVLLASWCALRFGEIAELRRKDIDLKAGTIKVERAVTVVDGETIPGVPKSMAGRRTVWVPPHLLPALAEHLDTYAATGPEGLLFPAIRDETRQIGYGSLHRQWRAAREAAGRPALHFHDLRHTAAVMAAQQGATPAELMVQLGHADPRMAMRYQHAARGRGAEIARRLSGMVPPPSE